MNAENKLVWLFISAVYFMVNMYIVGVFHDRAMRWKIILFLFGLPFGIVLTVWKQSSEYIGEFIDSSYYVIYWLESFIDPKSYKQKKIDWDYANRMLNGHPKKTGYKKFAIKLYIKRLMKLHNKTEL